MHKTSIAIISDSPAGYILSAHLEKAGKSVTLIDTGDCYHKELSHKMVEIPLYPADKIIRTALERINSLFSEPLSCNERELLPLTIETGTIKPFVGFGDSKSAAVPILSKYNVARRLDLDTTLEKKISELAAQLNIKTHIYAELNTLELSCSRVEKIVINGSQTIHADYFIFMNSPKELLRFLPNATWSSRVRSRITKSPCFAKVAIKLKHQLPHFDGQNLIFLTPNQSDQDPCVGQFIQNIDAQGAHYESTWETYVQNDLSDDPEYISSVLRNMRKLIRRAFITLEEKLHETIAVTPTAAGDYSWLLDQKISTQLADNIIIFPVLAAPYLGSAQCILSAQATLDQLLAYELREALPRVRSNPRI